MRTYLRAKRPYDFARFMYGPKGVCENLRISNKSRRDG